MVIGSINLSSYSVTANSSYEYYKSDGGEIIGGVQKITISGSVVISDQSNTKTGAIVMADLRRIVDLGKKPQCTLVNIPGHYSGQAKIENVTTSEGSDPTWINKGEFTIELKAPLSSIPANSFGIVASDSIVELNRSSRVELPEDSHGYVFSGGLFHKTFATASSELSFRCEPICQTNFNFIALISKLSRSDLHPYFSRFNSWNKYAKSRTVQITSNNSVTINTQYIITPHSSSAFVDLDFAHNRTYGDANSTKKIISGNVNGLTDVSIFNEYGFNDTCGASKLSNAESVFSIIRGMFSSIGSWQGITLELLELDNPNANNQQFNPCFNDDNDNANNNPCIKPSLSTVGRSRTEGAIDFSFEWESDDNEKCVDNNGVSKEVTIDVIEPQKQFVEFVIPLRGTLIQDLNTYNARRINVEITEKYPENLCGQPPVLCEDEQIQELIDSYLSGAFYLLIKNTITTSNNSVTRSQSYIECQ